MKNKLDVMATKMYLQKSISDIQSTIDVGNASRCYLSDFQQRRKCAVIPHNTKPKTDARVWFS